MALADVGIYGTGVMGLALARNLAGKNYKVVIANRTVQQARESLSKLKKHKESKNISLACDLSELTKKVKGPIILLIPSGDPQEDLISGQSTTPIDEVIFKGSLSIEENNKTTKIPPLTQLVNRNHVIIDAGNSHPYATAQRDFKLSKLKIKFLGMGVSGGEMGALKGPSLMPGGSYSTYKSIERILKSAAARKGKTVCCDWMGPGGAGHFVKIIHNGIEYAIMQAIAEAYWFLKTGFGYSNERLHKFFKECNKGKYRSYLLEITTHILNSKENGKYILDEILDSAGSKGTGKWTTQIAGDLGIAASAIYSALEARQISNKKREREELAKLYKLKLATSSSRQLLEEMVRDSLYATILTSYIQGFQIIAQASQEKTYIAPHLSENKKLYSYTKKDFSYNVNLSQVARVWKAGCIIRSNLLELFEDIFKKGNTENLLLERRVKSLLKKYHKNWKKSVLTAIDKNIPFSVNTSAINYYHSFLSKNLPANMTQAQRDLFGAHTFEKVNDNFTHHFFWGNKYSLTSQYKVSK